MFHWIYDAWKEGRIWTRGGGGSGGESQKKVSGGIERNAFVGSRDEVLQASPLLSLLLSSRIPQKPRKSRRKKYGKIENFPIAEETPPQLAQLATHFQTRTISTPRQTPRQQIMTCMNCVLKKRVSKQSDDIKAESSTKRGYTNGLKYCIHARARSRTRAHVPNYSPPIPRDGSDESAEDDQLIIGPHAPHFTNEILKEKGRKTKLKEYSLEESIRESPPALLITPIPLSPSRDKCRI